MRTMMKMTKALTFPFLLLALATTLVYMAGLASMQHSCYNLGGFPGPALQGTSTPTGAFGMSTGWDDCNKVFRFYWFIFAFVIVTLLGLMITAAMGVGLHFSRPFWIGMLSICIVLMMIASEAFLANEKMYDYNRGMGPASWIRRLQTTAAGAIMSVVSLVLLMLAVGTDWEHRAGHGRDVDKPISGVNTGVAVPVQNVRVVDQV